MENITKKGRKKYKKSKVEVKASANDFKKRKNKITSINIFCKNQVI